MRKLIAILVVAFILRFYGLNWDAGIHLHPDERMLIMVADRISLFGQMNPSFFNYGSLPIYLLRGISQIFGLANYDNMLHVGRYISIFFDLLTVIFIYKITKFLFKKVDVALFAGLLYSIAFFPIQNSHFFTVDTILTSLTTILVYLILQYANKPDVKKLLFLGVVCGALLATKFTAIIFLPFILVVIFLKNYNHLRNLLVYLIIFNFSFLIFSFIFMPYAFLGYKNFITDISSQIRMNNNPYIFPYTLQYVGTIPYWYYLKNIFLWGLGPIIAILSLTGSIALLLDCYISKEKKHTTIEQLNNVTIVVLFYFFYFLIIGHSAVKFMRYMLPLYPFFAVLAGVGTNALMSLRGARRRSNLLVRFLALFAVAGAILWTLMFLNIYSQPNTRVQATNWILKNIPVGSTLAVEHWDDRLPLFGQENYRILEMTLYDLPDDSFKWQILNAKLHAIDYIIISSNRLYVPLQKLTDCQKYNVCYPRTARYYQKLFDGTLGFKKVAEFAVYPGFSIFNFQFSIPDDNADESFTVYDHPKIMIFKRS